MRNVSSSVTKFYYCVAALNHADAAQVVDLIEDPPKDQPYDSLKQCLTELHTVNTFQRYQALMADKKPSTLMGKMCSLLPLDHRIHKTECFMFKGFFLAPKQPHPPDEGGHQGSQETCSQGRPYLAICLRPENQGSLLGLTSSSSSRRCCPQHSPSMSASPPFSLCCSSSCSTLCPFSCFVLLSELRPLLVPSQPRDQSQRCHSPCSRVSGN